MRTTVTLDDDAYELASLYAKGKGIKLGAAISELVRKGPAGAAKSAEAETPEGLVREANGLLVFASRGRRITPEMVKAALEEDD